MKLKFFDLNPAKNDDEEAEDEEEFEQKRLRVRFQKKRGDLSKWYDIFSDMQETVFEDLLLAPRSH